MVKVTLMNQSKVIKCKIRLDVPGYNKSGRFLFGSKDGTAMAKENRLKEINMLKNVPLQGVKFEKISSALDVYTIEEDGKTMAYAPIEVEVTADILEDILPLITRSDFSKIEIVEPSDITLDKGQGERLLTRIGLEYRNNM
ncbi:hypothetical protein PRVXH_001167 [Proteinivorax hydrogeniformans]|uniref:Uncharacterized protein n=1 Tax=Proteinivorax hydrogeniformans TaxID=1826727 RepID=A0AAU8HWN1_9FIRM